jgi:flagellar biosynthesis protein FlhB
VRVGALIGAGIALVRLVPALASRFERWWELALTSPNPAVYLNFLAGELFWLCLPVLLSGSVVAALALALQTRGRLWFWAASRSQEPWPKVPAQKSSLAERTPKLALGTALVVLVSVGLVVSLGATRDAVYAREVDTGAHLFELCQSLAGWLLLGGLLVGALEWLVARNAFQARHRMSHAELERERRDTVGSPETRRDRRMRHSTATQLRS